MATVIAVVAAPVLHNSVPVKLPAVSKDVPQLLVTDTVGAAGMVTGEAVPLPTVLVHPVIVLVCITV